MGCWRCYLGADGWGGRESANPWDIRCLDLASGGREDGLATKDQLRKQAQERGEQRGDVGVEKKEAVKRISMARQRHVWISLLSLQSLTLQRRRSGSNREGEEKVPADPPQRNQHLCMKSFFDC